jgi:hypothetical protein
MKHARALSFLSFAVAFALVAAGCSNDTASLAGTTQTTVSLSQAVLPASAVTAAFSITDGDSGRPGLIRRSMVDSLIVTVTQVDVLPESLLAHRHAGEDWGHRDGGPGRHGEGFGPFGPHGVRDSLRLRDSTQLRDSLGWGHLSEDWYTLDVSGSGHLDLMHLPTDSGSGLVLAVGTVPAGAYAGARLLVSTATIYFDTTFTVGTVTYVPGTGYPVTIPSGPQVGIRTRAGFTIAEGAAEVQLLFDPEATIRGAIVTRSGDIILAPPMMGHHMHHR